MIAHDIRPSAAAQRLSGEGAFEMLARARELEAQGHDVIHLEIGEPDFETPTHVKRAGIGGIERNQTHYAPSAGIPELRDAIGQNNYSCVASFVQAAGIEALRGPDDDVRAMVEEFRLRRDALVEGLNSLPGVTCKTPAGAFYAFPNVSAITRDDKRLAGFILDEGHVAALGGSSFGQAGRGYMRFSYANSLDAIALAVERLRDALPRFEHAG